MSTSNQEPRMPRARLLLRFAPLRRTAVPVVALALLLGAAPESRPTPVGAFSASADVGKVGRAGAARFDADKGEYRVTGCGENMWKAADAFHFVYSTLSGDFTLTADVRLAAPAAGGGNAHRKAGLVIRQGLEADAAYADVVAHGDGLVALQYRPERGAETKDQHAATTPAPTDAPVRLRLERRGPTLTAYMAAANEDTFREVGFVKLKLKDPVYVGLAVCSHVANASETATFSRVRLVETKPER